MYINNCLFVWWGLTPLSTIFQLYRGGQFYWKKPEYPFFRKSLTNLIIMLNTSPWAGVDPTISVVMDNDSIDSCKSSYHTIMSTPLPMCFGRVFTSCCINKDSCDEIISISQLWKYEIHRFILETYLLEMNQY